MKPYLLTALSVFLFCSCKTAPKPLVDLTGKRLLVLPFAYKGYHFGQHPLGEELARLVGGVVAARVDNVTICDAAPFSEMFVGKALEEVDWRRLAFAANADYILVGKILLFRQRNPRDVNIYQGRMDTEIWLYDQNGHQIVNKLVLARYPYRHPEFGGPPSFGLTPEEVSSRTKDRAAILIARLFYVPKEGED